MVTYYILGQYTGKNSDSMRNERRIQSYMSISISIVNIFNHTFPEFRCKCDWKFIEKEEHTHKV